MTDDEVGETLIALFTRVIDLYERQVKVNEDREAREAGIIAARAKIDDGF